ncbi:HAD-IIA family hydrolase [Paenibacillus hexagrammi]|uniref:Acid sugar phosphatase n=1 Tax=Paenibacillus hexagrammi TaxID=2908839 RepID=A0ABY3SGG8_9BACL|nr:HAD-IIA family hydrolase [Paenibacillus sp. YPD9-1]UJF32185.1 HAD-IIA family hydrolase [Paenibacillus sp. YPD9-1]
MTANANRAEHTDKLAVGQELLDLQQYKGYMFDLDGTIYAGNRLLPGVASALQLLRQRGKPLLFVTNTTIRTAESVKQRLEELGVVCGDDEVMTALCVSGMYFREHEPIARIFMIGEAAMKQELDRCGVETTEDALRATHVLVGLDRQFTYEKLTQGMRALRNGAQLIAANPDPFCPMDDGAIPDTWSLVKALETASLRQTAKVIGKPSAYYARKALERMGLAPQDCLMVGDRMETDIRFGHMNGMHTAFVLTGADSIEDIPSSGIEPDYVLASLSELAG